MHLIHCRYRCSILLVPFRAGHVLPPVSVEGLRLEFLGSIVTFDGLCLDDAGGVTALPVLGLGGDRSGDVTTRQSEGCAEGSQCRDEDTDDDFDNLLLGHSG